MSYFSDDFESGDYTTKGWVASVSPPNTIAVNNNAPVYDGTYSLKIYDQYNSGGAYLLKLMGDRSFLSSVATVYVRFDALPDVDTYLYRFLYLVPSGSSWDGLYMGGWGVDVYNSAGTAYWRLHSSDDGANKNDVLSIDGPVINTWYKVQVRAQGGNPGVASLFVNDIFEAINTSSAIMVAYGAIQGIALAVSPYTYPQTVNFAFDDVDFTPGSPLGPYGGKGRRRIYRKMSQMQYRMTAARGNPRGRRLKYPMG